MAVVFSQSYTFRDAKGNVSTTRLFVDTAAHAAAIRAALDALTNASLNAAHGIDAISPLPATYGAAGQFQSVEDKAHLTFTDASGQAHRYSVPAPLAAIFLADLETVDPANSLVGAFSTAILAGAFSRNGIAVTAFIGGVRIRRKLHRRLDIFTKNPAETGPGE